MNTSEIKPLLERVLRNLEADLAFAEDALTDPMVANSYVVTLNKDYDAILRVDVQGKGNFTGTLSTGRVFHLKGAIAAVEALKARPENAEYLKEASVDYERLTEVCKRAVEKLPGQIEYTKEALSKA